MKALSLTQPWATLVACGAKQIETRSWATRYRGPLAVHAAKGYPKWAREFALEPACYEAFRRRGASELWGGQTGHPLGAVVALCRLAECIPTSSVNFQALGVPEGLERAFGDYAPGRYAWILRDVKPLPEPIPAKGALGLWEWEFPSLTCCQHLNLEVE